MCRQQSVVHLQDPRLGVFALRPPCASSQPLQDSRSISAAHLEDDSPSPSIGISPSPYRQPLASPKFHRGAPSSRAGRRLDFRVSAVDRRAFADPFQNTVEAEPELPSRSAMLGVSSLMRPDAEAVEPSRSTMLGASCLMRPDANQARPACLTRFGPACVMSPFHPGEKRKQVGPSRPAVLGQASSASPLQVAGQVRLPQSAVIPACLNRDMGEMPRLRDGMREVPSVAAVASTSSESSLEADKHAEQENAQLQSRDGEKYEPSVSKSEGLLSIDEEHVRLGS